MDAFVSGAGTGGTIAGVGCYLKQRRPAVRVFLIDPPGSGLYNKVGGHEQKGCFGTLSSRAGHAAALSCGDLLCLSAVGF